MSKKEEASEKALLDGFSLQKDEHIFAVAGDERGKFFYWIVGYPASACLCRR